MNRRDPSTTPSVVLPSVSAEVFCHFPHVAKSPLGWRCIDFRFQRVPLNSNSGVGDVEILQRGSTRIAGHLVSPSSIYH